MLSHFARWRPGLLRPISWKGRRVVVVLQRISTDASGAGGSNGSTRVFSVPPEDLGMLPELERLQSGGPEFPPFALVLLKEASGAVGCAVLRKRAEEAGQPLSDAELEEADQITRALGVWMWMLKRK